MAWNKHLYLLVWQQNVVVDNHDNMRGGGRNSPINVSMEMHILSNRNKF